MSFEDVTLLGSVVNCFDSKRIPLSTRERESKQGHYPYYGAAGIIDHVNKPIFSGLYLLMGEDGSVVEENGTPVLQLVSGEFWVNNHAHVLQGETDLETRFIYYALKNTNIQGFVTGAVQPKLNQANMNNIPIYFPEKSARVRIVETLGCLDEKIELNRQTNATLEAIAQAIFKEWFVDFNFPGATGELVDSGLGPIPKGWRFTSLTSELNIVYGRNLPTTKLTTKGFPVFGGNGLLGFYTDYLYDEPQVIVSCRGAASGKVNQSLPKSFVTNNSLVFEIPKTSTITFPYLKFYCLNMDFRSFVSGSAQPQLTIDNLHQAKLLIPNSSSMTTFSQVVSAIEMIRIENDTQSKLLATMRDEILPKLMNGTIVM